MKYIFAITIILLSIVLLPCYAQVKGVDFTPTISFDSVKDIPYDLFPHEQLIETKDDGYFMAFKKTPTGYRNCINKAKRILSDNRKSFSKDRVEDDVMYPSNIKGLTDYQNMPRELMTGKAKVSIVWRLTNEYYLRLLCNQEFFAVFLTPSDGWGIEIEDY